MPNERPMFIFGAGGIGSYLTISMAPRREIYISDFDTVESKNTANQIYINDDVGKYKVDILRQLYPSNVYSFKDDKKMMKSMYAVGKKMRFDVVVATDSLFTRRKIFELLQGYAETESVYNRRVIKIIDARTNADMSNVYIFSMRDVCGYLEKLKREEELLNKTGENISSSCASRGSKKTDYTSGMRTAWMVWNALQKSNTDTGRVSLWNKDRLSWSEIQW